MNKEEKKEAKSDKGGIESRGRRILSQISYSLVVILELNNVSEVQYKGK